MKITICLQKHGQKRVTKIEGSWKSNSFASDHVQSFYQFKQGPNVMPWFAENMEKNIFDEEYERGRRIFWFENGKEIGIIHIQED